MTVAEAEKPASALMLVGFAACDAVIYLHYGLLWIGAAGCIATVLWRRALGEVEGSPLLSAASLAALYSLASGLLLFPVAMLLMAVRILYSVSDNTHARKAGKGGILTPLVNFLEDIEKPLKTPRQIVRKMLKDPVLVGYLVSMIFFVLLFSGELLVIQSPVKGSRREQIGSFLRDVGIFGAGSAYCFVILPTMILRHWRME